MEGKDVNDIRSFFIRNFYKWGINSEEEREEAVDKYFRRQKSWNKVRNKYGLIVQIIALIALFGLIAYTVYNADLLRTHPCRLCEDLGYICHSPILIKCSEIIECNDYNTQGGCEEDARTCKAGVNVACKSIMEKDGEWLVKDYCGCYWDEINQSCYYDYTLKKAGNDLE